MGLVIQRKSGFLKSCTYGKRITTAALALHSRQIISQCGLGCNVHASHCHDGNQSHLVHLVHVQVPDDVYREQCERKVADYAERTVHVGDDDDDFDVDAVALLCLVPEVGNRFALK